MSGVSEEAQVESGCSDGVDAEMSGGMANPVAVLLTEAREPNKFSVDMLDSLDQSTQTHF